MANENELHNAIFNTTTLIVLLIYALIALSVYWQYRKKKDILKKQAQLIEELQHPFLDETVRENETKVRKHWLIALCLYTATFFIPLFKPPFFPELFDAFSLTIQIALSIVFGTFFILACFPWFWIPYYCAYKKRGTAWLLWSIITIPLGEVIMVILDEHWILASAWSSFHIFHAIAYTSCEAIYWVNCLRLFKVNSAREDQMFLLAREHKA